MEALKDVGRFRKRKGSRFKGHEKPGEKRDTPPPQVPLPVDEGKIKEILAKVEKRLRQCTAGQLAAFSDGLDKGMRIATVDPTQVVV